jgi:hypothetical protein
MISIKIRSADARTHDKTNASNFNWFEEFKVVYIPSDSALWTANSTKGSEFLKDVFR